MEKEIEIFLKMSTWKNIIDTIYSSKIISKGNFWDGIQSIEDQLEEKDIKPKIDKNQLRIFND